MSFYNLKPFDPHYFHFAIFIRDFRSPYRPNTAILKEILKTTIKTRKHKYKTYSNAKKQYWGEYLVL